MVGCDLGVTATAPEGLVEAIESPDAHCLGAVRWRPGVFAASDPHVAVLRRTVVAAAARHGHATP